jgi:competence protein ComEC
MRGFLRGAMFCVCIYGLLVSGASAKTTKSLQIYFIDVEGGQATLIVSPSGQSMLVDTGWPDANGRDADRIVAAAKAAGIQQIDYVVITHYHIDHVGGVTQLADRMKIGTFIDHGPNQEDSEVTRRDYAAYQKILAKAKHLVVKPGDKIPVEGIEVEVLTAAGERITVPLPGAGRPNPLCAAEANPPVDASENARSTGLLGTYGRFRFLDLADLTKKKELELACPKDLLPTVDLYLVTHHGLDQSNAKSLVWALHPRVAVMNNGARKGGSPEAWQTVHDSPGLEDLWQLHYAVEAGKEHNVPEQFIANTGDSPDGQSIKATVLPDGTFTVLNSRNGYQKTYKK